jgi:hypothetical protein
MSRYQYHHLDSSMQEIRLLILQPGRGNSMVEVEIIHQSLADNPAYEALSYVWGDPTVTEDIHILTPPRGALEIQSSEAHKAAQGSPIDPMMPNHHKGDAAVSVDHSSHDENHSTNIFKATTSLKSALQHLRNSTKPRVIGVDAICSYSIDTKRNTPGT